jgi:hypothetical protein
MGELDGFAAIVPRKKETHVYPALRQSRPQDFPDRGPVHGEPNYLSVPLRSSGGCSTRPTLTAVILGNPVMAALGASLGSHHLR